MFREILNHDEITDSVGNPLEIANEQMWGIRRKMDECLSPKQCAGEKLDCWLKVGIKSERGIVRKKIIRYCDLRYCGQPILISEQNDFR